MSKNKDIVKEACKCKIMNFSRFDLAELEGHIQAQILEELDSLENAGSDCDCNEPNAYWWIYHGEWEEKQCTCLNCGGVIVK